MTPAELAAALDATKDETGIRAPSQPRTQRYRKNGRPTEPPSAASAATRATLARARAARPREVPIEARVADLVRRMIDAKLQGAEAVFCPEPFSTDRGLMNDDGTPGELLLPWRTTALMLGGAKYLGSLQLPGGSTNHIFLRDGEAVMVVWNDRPTRETLYLGEKVRQVDLWGRSTKPARGLSQFSPQRTWDRPLLRGASKPSRSIACRRSSPAQTSRWPASAIAVQFARPRAEHLRPAARDHAHMKNLFPSRAGRVTLACRKCGRDAQVDRVPRGRRRRIAAGLPDPASLQHRQRSHLSAPISTSKPTAPLQRLAELQVGLGDVTLKQPRLNAQGELEVTQQLVNDSDRRSPSAAPSLRPTAAG